MKARDSAAFRRAPSVLPREVTLYNKVLFSQGVRFRTWGFNTASTRDQCVVPGQRTPCDDRENGTRVIETQCPGTPPNRRCRLMNSSLSLGFTAERQYRYPR